MAKATKSARPSKMPMAGPMPPTGMKPMMGGPMPPVKMPPPRPMPSTSQKPAVNPALAKLPEQAKAYGVRGITPPKKGKR